MNKNPPSLLGKTLEELVVLAKETGWPAFVGNQIADWLYKKQVIEIQEMTNLSKSVRTQLGERFKIGRLDLKNRQTSTDGTRKYLFSLHEDLSIETVMIPEANRATLCVSSQAGCRMACRFCMTGRQGFRANLTSGEIIGQFHAVEERSRLTNAVYMGMGEPMDNLDEVLKSLQILTAPWGFAWSPRRITVSTIGILPALKRLLEESACHVAVSLHNPFGKERLELMPVEKVYPVEEVVRLIKQYDFSKQRRISFEYILFDRWNDTPQHVKALVKMLQGLSCRINLIRFHLIPDFPLLPSPESSMERFKNLLIQKGMTCTLRTSKGEDIMAACGLLSGQEH